LELQSQLHQKLVVSLPAHLFDQLHPDWQVVLQPHKELIDQIEKKVVGVEIAPAFENVFRSLSRSIQSTRVVIFGQDPYPTKGYAHGLAFSVDRSISPLPASLRNIYSELSTDCGVTKVSGDLSEWFDQGVMLVNRVLTTESGSSLAHTDLGWQVITDAVALELGRNDVVAILWGKNAGELSKYFRSTWRIQSVHPSPLSAYRGFFGSRPFSRCNAILVEHNKSEIRW
jgi:uracil-DNA glycosylase